MGAGQAHGDGGQQRHNIVGQQEATGPQHALGVGHGQELFEAVEIAKDIGGDYQVKSLLGRQVETLSDDVEVHRGDDGNEGGEDADGARFHVSGERRGGMGAAGAPIWSQRCAKRAPSPGPRSRQRCAAIARCRAGPVGRAAPPAPGGC